jgi:hypothetical protein
MGTTKRIAQEVHDNAHLYLATTTVGSLLGAGIVYRTLGEGSETFADLGREGSGRGGRDRGGVTIALHPENLVLGSVSRSDRSPLPLLKIRF